MESLGDIQREKNQGNKDFTFDSSRHKSWLRIDMVWMTKELGLLTNKVEIIKKYIRSQANTVADKGENKERKDMEN